MYHNMNIACLKDELKKRNASLRGKKADLIARLEDYDKHFGINNEKTEYLEDDCTGIITPSNEEYKDLNSSAKLPTFTRHHIQAFVEQYNKNIKIAAEMYKNRHLVTARAAVSGTYMFFRGQVKASMKKIMYVVDIKLMCSENACTIEESHCECAAGSGLEAHCKHVLVLMLGIEDMVRHSCIILHQVCTQQLLMFKKPKPFYASPMRCHNISKRKSDINFSPIKEEDVPESYNDYVRNLVINFGHTTAPIGQTIRPANTYAVQWDHSYSCVNKENEVLEALYLLNLSQEQILEIEYSTRLQTKSQEWLSLRKTHITASVFYNVCHCKPLNKKHMVEKIMLPKTFYSRATAYGQVQEPYALKKFEDDNNVKITKCGLYLSQSHPFLGASPDGLLGDFIIEVKCPFSAKYCEINTVTVPYLELINNELNLKKTHSYYAQIQGQLFCTNKQCALFLIYTIKDLKVIQIDRDNSFIDAMLEKLCDFYENYFKDMILDKYLYKNYNDLDK